ncbi:MAG: CcoQ/FixQ family Cbb3-type cytochrome c oxidase assembly chaperone [Proteobacteria bacterium]|nr:MAG: CcoQ/FixQ family Cbb3-type cytochrome c oxidase assembly chaperone [Pseudomonadota bacterium]
MKNEVLTLFPYINLVVVGQLTFFTVFVGSLFWVYRRGGKPYYDEMANLPLEGKEAGRE